ncbi:amidohydrolase family protein [Bizionia gelidisalsuginis]|uniref:Amidohydrolase family protein n=2 Tax=Bizionia TaxID=283785 RepID=A0A8H2QIC1_9FLAO|nr:MULTISPECIES: amidohydrolase family protein [Bizionia]TYB70487.1 amidohydrolase family protein [Bizionia saleffrena]TYC10635.1 amidohydrolase family protein [Bizionia gelidisalsuginis]
MTLLKYKLLGVALFFSTILLAQQTPAPKQTQAISIEGGTAHIGNGEVIDNALIIFTEGKLTFVGSALTETARQGTIINAKGKHIYPGFIAPNSTLGLVEIDAVRATEDQDEVGKMNPHIRSIIAYNTESKVVESMRINGVLMGQITPRGGRISGTSSVVQFDAWNWEDAVIKEDDGIHLNWPNPFSRGRWWLGEPATLKENKEYNNQVDELTTYFNENAVYQIGKNTSRHLPFEALNGVVTGKKTLYVHVDNEKGITDAINFKTANNIKKLVIVGGNEAHLVSNLLVKHNIPVLLQRVHSRPNNDDDDYDLPFTLANRLVKDGVLVGLENSGGMERMNTRNLPFLAGTCAAYGLDKEKALSLITLNTAKILGIDDTVGSLEVGKDATFFISEGDALDMRTNKIDKAYIQGRDVILKSHQTELYERYSNKYKDNN